LNLLHAILNFFKRIPSDSNAVQTNEEVEKRNWEIRQNDLGVFTYHSSSFEIDLKNECHLIKWTDIERIEAYKADLMTTDEICLDIIYNNKTITITEETFGWYQFINRMKSALSIINDNWEASVLKTPFEYDLTTIYERTDRIMPLKSNFNSAIKTTDKQAVNYIFQKHGWSIHKPSLISYKYENSWSILTLETGKDDLLLHGLVAFHPGNVKIIKQVYEDLGFYYEFKFHDEHDQLIVEDKKGL